MTKIHPTAVIAKGALLDDDVEVGPYSVIGEFVRVGRGTSIGSHVVLQGRTEIGPNNRFFQFSSIGEVPQDLKYKGEPTRLKIGEGNTFREGVTVHLGTEKGGGVTTIENNNLFMAYSHVAHDCHIGDGTVFANSVSLAGHVSVENYAIIGGLCGIHQFVRIGESALVGAGSMVSLDIPPYVIAQGDHARLHGINTIGLQRRGWSREAIDSVKKAYKLLFRSRLKLDQALKRVAQEIPNSEPVKHLIDFIRKTERGICR